MGPAGAAAAAAVKPRPWTLCVWVLSGHVTANAGMKHDMGAGRSRAAGVAAASPPSRVQSLIPATVRISSGRHSRSCETVRFYDWPARPPACVHKHVGLWVCKGLWGLGGCSWCPLSLTVGMCIVQCAKYTVVRIREKVKGELGCLLLILWEPLQCLKVNSMVSHSFVFLSKMLKI